MYDTPAETSPFDGFFKPNKKYLCIKKPKEESTLRVGFIYILEESRIRTYYNEIDYLFSFAEVGDFECGGMICLTKDEYEAEKFKEFFIEITDQEEESVLLKYKDEREKAIAAEKRCYWFKVGSRYLYKKAVQYPGTLVNCLKVGKVYTCTGQAYFGYFDGFEPQCVLFKTYDPPFWENYFEEIKE